MEGNQQIKKIAITTTFFLSLFLFPVSVKAQSKNIISSCRVYRANLSNSLDSYVNQGKCIIRTRIEGDYIMVRVETPWPSPEGKKDVDIMRLTNKPSCTNWSPHSSKECSGDFWYGNDKGWGYVSAAQYKENGNVKFGYDIGKIYSVEFDGAFPKPKSTDYVATKNDWINQIKTFYPEKNKTEIEKLLKSRHKSLKNSLGGNHVNSDISFKNYLKFVFSVIDNRYQRKNNIPTLQEAIDAADYGIGNPM